jgi:hypothetical protein
MRGDGVTGGRKPRQQSAELDVTALAPLSDRSMIGASLVSTAAMQGNVSNDVVEARADP